MLDSAIDIQDMHTMKKSRQFAFDLKYACSLSHTTFDTILKSISKVNSTVSNCK